MLRVSYYKPFLKSCKNNHSFDSCRFKGQNNDFKVLKEKLDQNIPNIDQFLQGEAIIKDVSGQSVTVKIMSTSPKDALEVKDWHLPKPAGEPTYAANTKWMDWWQSVITTSSNPNHSNSYQVFKLVTSDNIILGVMALIKNLKDITDGVITTWVEGVRISPRVNQRMISKPDYKGVGSALITYAVIQSFHNGDEGIGLNSTLGAEEFYKKLGFNQRASPDGKRTLFYLKGFEERLNFLKKRFESYNSQESCNRVKRIVV